MKSLKVGIVGTGYAAKKRAEAILADKRAELVYVTGNSPEKIQDFSQTYSVIGIDSWQQLVNREELDLIFVCTINRDHGAIARAALESSKHVVVEYPLALDFTEAATIISLAESKHKLLHVEHIELIGGLHQAMKQHLSAIGNVFYARYITIAPQREVDPSWKYHRAMFGFPLAAALSRIHRLTDLFGEVATVTCRDRYWDVPNTDYFKSCLCHAQLNFCQGVIADITYGKGNVFWHGQRIFEIHGDQGTLLFEGQKGKLIRDKEIIEIPVVSRRGLFTKDTTMVLDYLTNNKPLYVKPQASLYALKVAEKARQAGSTGRVIKVNSDNQTVEANPLIS